MDRGMINLLKGLAFCVFLYLTSFLGSIFMMGPAIPLLWVKTNWFRKCQDFMIQSWLILPGALLELFFATKVIVTGDKISRDESTLIMMNHRCRLDWLFYWMILLRYGRLDREKIIMKDEVKHVPGAGWAMQNAFYMFLRRRWEQDHSYLTQVLDYFKSLNYPLQLLIFPEGTNYCKESKEKSDSFANKNGFQTYEYVLHPRVRGFNFLVSYLRQKPLKSVLNVTIGYPKRFCYGELDLLCGHFPEEIHVDVRRHEIDELPVESDEIDQWCIKKWAEKEIKLRKFYKEGKFTEKDHIDETYKRKVNERADRTMKLIVGYWIIFLCITFYALFTFWPARWFGLSVLIYYIAVMFIYGGTDILQLEVFQKDKPPGSLNNQKQQ